MMHSISHAATWLDLVVGADYHVVNTPTPTLARQPFIALAGDPVGAAISAASTPLMSLLTGQGWKAPSGPVFVNGRPILKAGSSSYNLTLLPHFPLVPGVFARIPSGVGKHRLGAVDALVGESNISRVFDVVWTCSDPKALPLSMVVQVPKGRPVFVGGMPGLNIVEALHNWMAGRITRTVFGAVGRLAGFIGRHSLARLRNVVPASLRMLTGHPVDVATGAVVNEAVDFELPGPLPMRFSRSYSSAWAGRLTDLGWGWSHSLDVALWREPEGITLRREDGRELVFDVSTHAGGEVPIGTKLFDEITGLELERTGAGSWVVRTGDGLVELFEELPDEPLMTSDRTGMARRVAIVSHDCAHALTFKWIKGRLAGAIDSCGREVQFRHDESGFLSRVELPDPVRVGAFIRHLTLRYREGCLVEAEDAMGQTAKFQYCARLLVGEKRRNGVRFFWGYDGVGATARCVRTWGFGPSTDDVTPIFHQKLSYDPINRKTWRLDSDGNQTEFVANELGLVVSVRDPLGGVKTSVFDGFRLVSETDAVGGVWQWSHDDRGRVTETVAPDGAMTSVSYDPHFPWCVSEVRDPRGAVWRHRRDSKARLVATEGPEGALRTFTWSQGLLVAEKDSRGEATEYQYDEAKNLVSMKLPSGAVRRQAFDRRGAPIASWWREGDGQEECLREEVVRDLLGHIEKQRQADGSINLITRDGEGNITAIAGRRTRQEFTYTGFDWLKTVEDGGERVTFAYHAEGELRSVSNEAGLEASYQLDSCRRVSVEQGFDIRTKVRLKRDAAGRVVETEWIRRQGGVVARTRYLLDALGRLERREHADGTWEQFHYDRAGDVIEANSPHHRVVLSRNALGAVVTERQDEHEIKYSYAGDRLAGLESSLGAYLALVWSSDGRSQNACLDEMGPTTVFQIDRQFDGFGREQARAMKNGLSARWLRDMAGRPTELLVSRDADGRRTGWWRDYVWSEGDRLEAFHDTRYGNSRFERDARGRTIAEIRDEVRTVRRFDLVGDVYRTMDGTDRTYAFAGMLREANGRTCAYDYLGRLIQRADNRGHGFVFRWDGAGQLVGVFRRDHQGEHEEDALTFTYDAFGRRLTKSKNGRVTRFFWSGSQVLHEWSPGEDLNTWYPDPDGPGYLAHVRGGERAMVVSDHVGTPTTLIDEGGRGHCWQQLDLLGRPLSAGENDGGGDEASSLECPWRWPGQYADNETGLFYNRFRYYDPELGLYLSPDPLGIAGGLAAYAYVPDPLLFIDPLGLSILDIGGANAEVGAMSRDKMPGMNVMESESALSRTFGRAGAQTLRADVGTTMRARVVPDLKDIGAKFGARFQQRLSHLVDYGRALPHFIRDNGLCR